ncbi:hypothetical protein FRB90_010746, partial [Tulasnella sp. 427]
VLGGREPYGDYRTNRGVTDAMARDELPLPVHEEFGSLEEGQALEDLWAACWSREPSARPSANDLKAKLETLLK